MMTMDDMPIGDVEKGCDDKGEVTNKTSESSFADDHKEPSLPFGSSKDGKQKNLVWSGINLKLMDKKSKDGVKLDILKDVWGTAEVGKTTAIMGASGAGSKCFVSFSSSPDSI